MKGNTRNEKRVVNTKRKKTTGNIKDNVLELLNSVENKTFSIKQIIKTLRLVTIAKRNELSEALEFLESDGDVKRMPDGSYKSERKATETIVGVVDLVNPRYAYIICEGMDEDVIVTSNDLKGAMDGDKVSIVIYARKKKKEKHPEGEVIEVLERKRTEFVGKIEISDRYAFVVPDARKMYFDIFIKGGDTLNAKHKDKVLVQITEWPTATKNPAGKVVEVLGSAGENEVEMHSIMLEYGLPYEFPQRVTQEAEDIAVEIPAEEIKKRRDFRNITTFTIDPVDAKDFDDALSIQKLDNGHYEIGVHIADVTHYVEPLTELEQEAYKRATSVYLVDRVVPMLPEKLSNGLCSLRPNEDKLTFSAVFEMDENAKIHKQWFGKTVIHSDRRFAYEEVQEIIETENGDFAQEIKTLNTLAHKLREQRFRNGSIAFETVEVKFNLDEKGKPLSVYQKVRVDAHKLIEDFMLLANKKVAEYVYFMIKNEDQKLTMVYRTHDDPDPDKISALAEFAKKFGHTVQAESKNLPNELNKLAIAAEGKPEQNVLQNLAIRAMAKAKYTTSASGHFGLAFDHYTHFTSPIRRYPDMMVHRLLFQYLEKPLTANAREYEEKCKHSSEREKVAADAERASIKYKQVEYMQTMEGKIFDGIISGVAEWGLFIEISDTKCEGLIRMADLNDDYYDLDQANYRIVGRRRGRIYTLGDGLRVKVKSTDLDKRTIDLSLVNWLEV